MKNINKNGANKCPKIKYFLSSINTSDTSYLINFSN